MSEVSLFVPIVPPSANHMKVWLPKMKRFVPASKYAKVKKDITAYLRANWVLPLISAVWGKRKGLKVLMDGHVTLIVRLHLRSPHKIDVDNSMKAVLDAMSGIIYEDDKQIYDLRVLKVPTNDVEGFSFSIERMEVNVPELTDIKPSVKKKEKVEDKYLPSNKPLVVTTEDTKEYKTVKEFLKAKGLC